MSVVGGLRAASQLERMLQDGESFERVEEFIERRLISEEQKAALWLLARAEADAGTRGRVFAWCDPVRGGPRSGERARWTRVT